MLLRDAWLDLVAGGCCVGCGTPGRALCAGCAALLPREAREYRPTPCPPGLARCFATGEYADLLRALVLAHKEQGCFSLARPLGRLLAAAVDRLLAESDVAWSGARVVLVPVPSRPGAVRARGHDPMARAARAAVRELVGRGRPARVARLLRVAAPVADQAGLSSTERAANLHGSMRVHPPARRNQVRAGIAVTAVVCDDVLTTGATAREAQRALQDSGIPVLGVATMAATRKRWTG